MSDVILSAENLYKSFSTGIENTKIKITCGVNIEIKSGEFTVLMGSSGSGKSTLLYLLSGLESLTSGDIWFKNQNISNMSEKNLALLRRKSMGFVFQSFNMLPNLTLLENILIAGYFGNTNKKEVEQNALQLLNNFGLGHLANRKPAQVSGGEQQRAAIVRALINSPDIIFADEPTGALNSSSGMNVLEHFTSLSAKGQTLFMVTHDIKGACRGNRVLYMKDGKINGEYKFENNNMSFNEKEELLFKWLTKQGW